MDYRTKPLRAGTLVFSALGVCLATFFITSCANNTGPQYTDPPPAAFVYVSSSDNASNEQISAFAADSEGKLTPVTGSPFPGTGAYMAVNKKWLFSSDTVNIYSFSIAADGGLKQVDSINAQQFNGYAVGGPVYLFFDRTGSTLYDFDIYGSQAANNTYQFFDIDQQSGVLSYLGATSAASADWQTPLTFTGDDHFAYGSSCYHGFQNIYGFSRDSNGTLSTLDTIAPFPSTPNGAYCPYWAASDAYSHLAISLTPNEELTNTGPTQLATYTVDSAGNLSTSSTSDNMPPIAVGDVLDMKISPSGKLLAVAGTGGLQVFHFNGPNPITPFTPVLTSDSIAQVAWDKDNHLYALSLSAGELLVFTATPVAVSPASGSPYITPNATNIAVLPET